MLAAFLERVDFPHEAVLYSAFIHAHYRGTASDLSIRYPDGKEKMLIAVPHYQFGWQRHYTFAEPVKVPAGSRLIAHYAYDNSKQNPANHPKQNPSAKPTTHNTSRFRSRSPSVQHRL
jgi:hypothetical protein